MPGFQLLSDANQMRAHSGGAMPSPLVFNVIIPEGDSITSGMPSTPNGSYAYQYDTYRSDKTVEVRAQGSRSVGTAADLNNNGNTLSGNVAEDLAYGPDLISYMMGANDLGLSTWANMRANLIALYNAYKAADPSVKIAWSPPIAYNPTGTPNPGKANFDTQRASMLAECRDPANWSLWCDYFFPMGEIPDFGDVSLAAPLFGDGVHPTPAGQSLLYASYKPAMDSILDAARASSTAPYASVWPVNESSLAANTEVVRRFLLAGLNPSVPHTMSVTGAELRLNGGAWVTSITRVYNGDIIDIRKTTSATALASVLYSLTIGSETRVISLTTVANVTPVNYLHKGFATDPNPVAVKTYTGLAFDTGLAIIGVNSSNVPTGVTVGGVAATKVMDQDGLTVWTCPVAADGSYSVVITRAAATSRNVITYGTLKDADATPIQSVSGRPLNQSSPHPTASVAVPANGLALAWLREEAGATITPVSSMVAPSVLIAEGNTIYQSQINGLALASRTGTGTVSFNFIFGSYSRGAVVFKAAGT